MNDDLLYRCNRVPWQRREKTHDGAQARITERETRFAAFGVGRVIASQAIFPGEGGLSNRSGMTCAGRGPKVTRGLPIVLVVLLILVGVYPLSSSFASPTSPVGTARVNPGEAVPEAGLWHVESIGFERPFGRERVVVVLSGKTVVGIPRPSLLVMKDGGESVVLKMEDTYVAESLRRPWGETLAGNVSRVIPHQVTVGGKQWVHLVVDLKEKVPHTVRREGDNVLLEFNVASLTHKKTASPPGTAVAQRKESPVVRDSSGLPPRDVSPGVQAVAPQLISLDFQEASVKSVLRLLAEMGGVNIVSGDDVKGTVTIHLRNVPWEQALEVILEVRQLAHRRIGDVITVMTVERMRKEEAERAVVLEAKWRAEQERQRLMLEKERLDMEALAQAERERLVIKGVEPGAEVFVDMDIRRVFQLLAEERRRQGERLSIVATDDVRGTLTADLREVPWEQRLQTILDIRGLAKRRVGDVITVMTAERMRKDEAERALAEMARRKTEQEYREREQKMAAEQVKLEQARRKETLVLTRPPLVTRVVPIRYASPKLLQENLQELLLKDEREGIPHGSVRVDGHSNSLIVQAMKEDMARLLALIAKLDTPVSQVSIRANIVETTRDTARSLGVMWGGVYGTRVDGRNLIVTPGGKGQIPGIDGAPWATVPPGQAFTGGYLPAFGSRGIGGQGFGVNFPATGLTDAASATLGLMFGNIGGNILELQLQALQQEGKLNIISSPQITTLDNQMAFTENGERIPYVSIDRDGRPEVRFQDAVLRLEITPSIIDDGSLKMNVVIKKDEVDTSRSVAGNPFIIRKQTETSLIVRDGETIVISGLARQRKLEGVRGVPWLQNIPVLGWLFKAENRDETMEEVVIFITPNILRARVETGIQTGS